MSDPCESKSSSSGFVMSSVPGSPSPEGEIKLHKIDAAICELCLNGAGGECHVPGCAFWIMDAPLPSETGPLHYLTSFTESAAL